MNNKPIGVLDSGLGGLTVWKELVTLLPNESTIYLGDSANAPYGKKSPEEIYRLAKKLIEFLFTKKVKLIVIACNTITVSAIDKLRKEYPSLSIIGTVPAIKPAVSATKNARIGLLVTARTAESDYLHNLIATFAGTKEVFIQGTNELVPLIEAGKKDSQDMQHVLTPIMQHFKDKNIDTLVLGSTHFPFLRDYMQLVLGSDVLILDSGEAIAKQVKRILEEKHLFQMLEKSKFEFYTTGDTKIAKNLLAGTIAEGKEFKKVIL